MADLDAAQAASAGHESARQARENAAIHPSSAGHEASAFPHSHAPHEPAGTVEPAPAHEAAVPREAAAPPEPIASREPGPEPVTHPDAHEPPESRPSNGDQQHTPAGLAQQASTPETVQPAEWWPEPPPSEGESRPIHEHRAADPQETREHAAFEDESDEPLDEHAPYRSAPARPASDHLDPAPPAAAPRPMAVAGGRIPPPPTRRDALLDRRARRLHRHRGEASGSRSLVSPGRIAALVALALLIAVLWFLVSLFQPLKGTGHGRVVVIIPHGSGAHAIGNLLASRGVVSSGFFFDLRAAVDGKRGQLHSGVYTLARDMSYGAAIGQLSKPPPPPPVVRVLVPEGYARVLTAQIARDDGLAGDYLAASRRSPLLNPTSYGAPRGTPHLEGFLYPATYDLKVGTDVNGLVSEQLTAFKSHFGPPQAAAARALHVSLYGLLTVASMVEREALLSRDRPLVAAVIYNRLRTHTPLGIDATIRYALNKWSSPLTVSDLRISSPYNTRTHDGLPPTPIGSPGLASVAAAAHPAHVPYLYYVNGSDGCGDLKFSTGFSQFQADSAAYQAALTRNGGRVPHCHR